MADRAKLIASLTESPSEADLEALSSRADCLEVRADLLPEVSSTWLQWLRTHYSGDLLYTLRSRSEGGESDLTPEERRAALAAASANFDLIDLEGARDLVPELLAEIPQDRRLISWARISERRDR